MVAIYRTIVERFTSGNRDGARQLFEDLLPVLAFSNQHIDISVQFFKRVLVAKGVFQTAMVRRPILEFDAVQERAAAVLAERVVSLEADVKPEEVISPGTHGAADSARREIGR